MIYAIYVMLLSDSVLDLTAGAFRLYSPHRQVEVYYARVVGFTTETNTVSVGHMYVCRLYLT